MPGHKVPAFTLFDSYILLNTNVSSSMELTCIYVFVCIADDKMMSCLVLSYTANVFRHYCKSTERRLIGGAQRQPREPQL